MAMVSLKQLTALCLECHICSGHGQSGCSHSAFNVISKGLLEIPLWVVHLEPDFSHFGLKSLLHVVKEL